MVDTVREIHIFPVHGEPGRDLDEAEVEREGLAGDRRKKAPVQVVSDQDVRADTRANLVVSLPSAVLAQSVGGVLVVGDVELDVTGAPSSCPGVYAAVRRTGIVRVGDLVTMSHEPGLTEPGLTEPGLTEPGLTGPGVTEPGVTSADAAQ